MGAGSMVDNTTGLGNVAIGLDSLQSNTGIGVDNTAIGCGALTTNRYS